MTLGEKISALRNASSLSQGDLAEKLKVSRQSISKWETNASVPELDKLIQLSDLFHISLDELVRCETIHVEKSDSVMKEKTNAGSKAAESQTLPQKPVSTQRIIGFILLANGLLCCILALALGGSLFVIGGYMLFCSVICLLVKKHAGLIIGGITFLQAMVVSWRYTSVRMSLVLNPGYYRHTTPIAGMIAIAMWMILFLLIYLTFRAFCKKKK